MGAGVSHKSVLSLSLSLSDVDKNIQEPPHKRGLEDSKKTGMEEHAHSKLLHHYFFYILVV